MAFPPSERERPEAVELRTKLGALERRRFGEGDHHRELFQAYDADRDGECRASEIRAMLADAGVGNGLTRGAWVRGLLAHLDRDRSGGVTYEEFVSAVQGSVPAPPPAQPRQLPPDPKPQPAPALPERPEERPKTHPPASPRPSPIGAVAGLLLVALVALALRSRGSRVR